MKRNIIISIILISISIVSCTKLPDKEGDGTSISTPVNTSISENSGLVLTTNNNSASLLVPNLQIENANFNSLYFVTNAASIFYLQNDRLCSASIDGTNINEMDEGCNWNGLALDDSYVYYLKTDGLYRLGLDGKVKEKLFGGKEIREFRVIGNRIVYQTGKNIYLFNIATKKTEAIVTADQGTGLICSSNKVYYMLDNNYPNSIFSFNEYDLQTKTTKLIKEDPNLRADFTIIDNKLYYIDSKKMSLNVINLADGTTEQILPHLINILGSFHQFIIYHMVSEDLSSSEIRAYNTINGKDYLIGMVDDGNNILEICSNDDNLFLLTIGIPDYKSASGNDIYYIYRVDFSDRGIDMNRIIEIEYSSNID